MGTRHDLMALHAWHFAAGPTTFPSRAPSEAPTWLPSRAPSEAPTRPPTGTANLHSERCQRWLLSNLACTCGWPLLVIRGPDGFAYPRPNNGPQFSTHRCGHSRACSIFP